MRFVPAVVIALLLGLGLVMHCEAAADFPLDRGRLEQLRDSVDVQADRVDYSERDHKIVASGAVELTFGARRLFADEVTVDLDDQVVVASGHVILTEGANRLDGERIEYNYATNLGVITNGRGTLESGVGFSGVEIRREGERQYALKDARFTGCRACQPEPQTPDWEFRATDATIFQDEWITSRNTSFWLKGIPSLYAPALVFPIGPRRTGFLIPRFGYGNRDGFTIRQPFFWAISRSQDATFTPIYRTNRGFEINGEYRYVLDEVSHGEISGRYVHDTLSSEKTERGELRWLHRQTLSPTWVFRADARYQNDRTVNRDFVDSTVTDRTQRVLDSNVFLAQTTSRYTLLGLLEVTEDLTNVGDQRLSRLPEVRFQWLPDSLLNSPLVGELTTSAVYFERSGTDSAGRFDLRPLVHLPVSPFPWLTATTSVGLRETAYTAAEQSGDSSNRFLATAAQRFASTLVRRFENPGLGLTRLTHLVEPSIQYDYVPWVDQQSLLQFDAADFVNPQNRVTYRLANRWMARSHAASGEVQTYEAASLSVSQSVNLQPKTREFSDPYLEALTPERVDQAVKDSHTLSNGFTRATERRFSNLVVQAGFRPLPAIGGYATTAVNTERLGVEAVNSGVELRLSDDLFVETGHTYVEGRQVNGVVNRIIWKVAKNLSLDVLTRYDFRSSSLLENTANLRFSTCCWEAGLKYTHRTRGAGLSDENSVQVTIELKMPNAPAAR